MRGDCQETVSVLDGVGLETVFLERNSLRIINFFLKNNSLQANNVENRNSLLTVSKRSPGLYAFREGEGT